jgi:hypothetical protein
MIERQTRSGGCDKPSGQPEGIANSPQRYSKRLYSSALYVRYTVEGIQGRNQWHLCDWIDQLNGRFHDLILCHWTDCGQPDANHHSRQFLLGSEEADYSGINSCQGNNPIFEIIFSLFCLDFTIGFPGLCYWNIRVVRYLRSRSHSALSSEPNYPYPSLY